MRGVIALLCALTAAGPVWAQRLGLSGDFDPRYAWYDGPTTTRAGDARMRIVFAGREGEAALTPNQYWHYEQVYRRHLARFAFAMPVEQAEPRARHAAFRDVVLRYPDMVVTGFDLEPIDGGRIAPSF
ncbi:hypothetical protein [uncultured Jannaschia sp.]|uniref:hypothetical protein n=1 Tax=uncultured Jannaschia sp. TaxID=293347 RepID=UPI0026039FEF|nr:hypothetical protein [uncultured Jannaschia sp.]